MANSLQHYDAIQNIIESVYGDNILIGNHYCSEEEYACLLEYVSQICNSYLINGEFFKKNDYRIIFITLVEIAKRWTDNDDSNASDNEDKNGFWQYTFKTLIGTFNAGIYLEFQKCIKGLKMHYNVPIIECGKKYYATIMMHSYSPASSMYAFFDLCYNVFKNDLDFGFTSEDKWVYGTIAQQLKIVLNGNYSEDKKVSIGSSAYNIKIGLRSFALHDDLSSEFIDFIQNILSRIERLFNNEKICINNKVDRDIIEWWKLQKTESLDNKEHAKKIPTVSINDISAKYIRNDKDVLLCIPSIRLDDGNVNMSYEVYCGNNMIYTDKMATKIGELVTSTKPVNLDLKDIIKDNGNINCRLIIRDGNNIIFDSCRNKRTTLDRDFILFEDNKEVISDINKPSNYFVCSPHIDALKTKPTEIATISKYLYNIYPAAGECLVGERRSVFFIDQTKESQYGKNVCLIGNRENIEWKLGDISCTVFSDDVKLIIPNTLNIKALEVKIDKKPYKLNTLKFEQSDDNVYRFGLYKLGIIKAEEPVEIELYSYEKKKTILERTNVIVLPRLNIQLANELYYGETAKRHGSVTVDNVSEKFSWAYNASEALFTIQEGELMIKIPYLRWKIDNGEWNTRPLSHIVWYEQLFSNTSVMHIDNPSHGDVVLELSIDGGHNTQIVSNQSGGYEIGRAIYTVIGQGKKLSLRMRIKDVEYKVVDLAIQECFLSNPVKYVDKKVLWCPNTTFIGKAESEFRIIAESKSDAKRNGDIIVGTTNVEFNNFDDDIYNIIIYIKNRNSFLSPYTQIYHCELVVGDPKKFRFINKYIRLIRVFCYNKQYTTLIPIYYVDNLEYIQENGEDCYRGRLCEIDKTSGQEIVLNAMRNLIQEYEDTNPVRIELRDNRTLWLAAGWQGDNDHFSLFCDINRGRICNIEQENRMYSMINYYIFEEVNYV